MRSVWLWRFDRGYARAGLRRQYTKSVVIALCLVIIACQVAGARASVDVRGRIREGTSSFKDVTIKSRITHTDSAELKKINRDFVLGYEVKSTTVRYKSPDKLRIDGHLGLLSASMIIDGNEKGFRIPVRGWVKQNIASKPHERQSDLDLGIVTESLWRNYAVNETKTEDDSGRLIYKIIFSWPNTLDRRHVCWVDANTLKLLKRERLDEGKVVAKYIYSDHKLVDGIWVPGRIDVYNGEGKLAATTVYQSIKVNTSIPDSVFDFK